MADRPGSDEHYERALQCIVQSSKTRGGRRGEAYWLRLAQVHATLATVYAEPSETESHHVVFQDQHEIVCVCGVVMLCGGNLDSPAKALGRHISAFRAEALGRRASALLKAALEAGDG